MAYGTVKVDNVTFTYNSADATTTFSGFYASTTNNLTLSGTASANTFTGTTANFTNTNAQNISVTTLLSGLAITGGTAGFTIVTGTTVTGTTANFVTVSGTTVTGTTAQFTSITGGTAGFTTITGTTVTGTTANFVTVSGTTVTGTTASFTSGIFTSLSGTTHTITSGVFALGTAALPSISFVSDPNTGIYSPGADQVAVATNGVERVEFGTAEVVFNDGGENYDFRVEGDTSSHLLFVDASTDCVGIGSSSPSANLEVKTTSDVGIALTNSSSVTSGNRGSISMLNSANSSVGTIRFAAVTDNVGTEIQFYTRPAAGSLTQSMTLDSAGRLGLGISPSNWSGYKVLQAGIASFIGASSGSYILSDNCYTDDAGVSWKYISSSYAAAQYYAAAGAHVWRTASSGTANNVVSFTQALTLDSSGRLGIGTSSPTEAVLVVNNPNGSTDNGVTGNTIFVKAATVNSNLVRFSGAATTDLLVGRFGATDNISIGTTSGTTIATFKSDGKVGIGSTTPSAKLVCDGHVQITNAAPPTTGAGLELSYGQINASRTSQQSYNRTGSAYLGSDYDALDYRWYISGSQKATIDSSGNLLVGGTSNTAGSRILAENASGDQIAIRYTGIATYYLNTTSGGDLAINKDASERLRIDSSGRLLVGTSTARTDYFNNSLTAMLQVEGTNFGGNADRACISIVNNNNVTVLEAPVLILGRSNGSTVNSRTLVSDGTLCGYISFQGADGSDLVEAASIAAEINGTVGANRMPGRLVFSTATDASPSVMTERMRITSAGVLQIAEAGNITVGTTTGTKIGTATTQKLGFYNATPVVQPTAVADATTAVDVITQLNALLAKLRTLGIIAT